jgi:hypothetical protein
MTEEEELKLVSELVRITERLNEQMCFVSAEWEDVSSDDDEDFEDADIDRNGMLQIVRVDRFVENGRYENIGGKNERL